MVLTIAFWDALRILSCAAALVVVACVPFSLTKPRMTWDQKLRMLGEFLLAGAVVGAYLYSLGTWPEQWWRNVLVFAGVTVIAIGQYRFLQRYRHAVSRLHRR